MGLKIVGAVIVVVSLLGLFSVKPKLDAASSLGGQLAIGLSSLTGGSAQQELQNYQLAYNLSIAGLVLGAIVTIVGFLRKPTTA